MFDPLGNQYFLEQAQVEEWYGNRDLSQHLLASHRETESQKNTRTCWSRLERRSSGVRHEQERGREMSAMRLETPIEFDQSHVILRDMMTGRGIRPIIARKSKNARLMW